MVGRMTAISRAIVVNLCRLEVLGGGADEPALIRGRFTCVNIDAHLLGVLDSSESHVVSVLVPVGDAGSSKDTPVTSPNSFSYELSRDFLMSSVQSSTKPISLKTDFRPFLMLLPPIGEEGKTTEPSLNRSEVMLESNLGRRGTASFSEL
jgi:hypothetical protein